MEVIWLICWQCHLNRQGHALLWTQQSSLMLQSTDSRPYCEQISFIKSSSTNLVIHFFLFILCVISTRTHPVIPLVGRSKVYSIILDWRHKITKSTFFQSPKCIAVIHLAIPNFFENLCNPLGFCEQSSNFLTGCRKACG